MKEPDMKAIISIALENMWNLPKSLSNTRLTHAADFVIGFLEVVTFFFEL